MNSSDLNFGSKANPIKSQQKQAKVAETTLAKHLQFGTPESQRVLATAAAQGNTLGASPEELQFLDDMTNASDTEIFNKYGRDAVLNRGNYLRQVQGLREDKAEGRTAGDLARDIPVTIAKGAGNLVSGAVGLGLSGFDSLTKGFWTQAEEQLGFESTPTAETWAGVSERFNQMMEGQFSEKGQAQNKQAQLESTLDAEDRDRRFEAQEDQGFFAQAEKELEGLGDFFENLGDNPSQITNIVGEGVGSMLPIAKVVQLGAKANITRQMGNKAATEFLRTKAGRAALQEEAAKLVPAVTAITEGGSSGIQARQEILGMSHEELMESPEYQRLIESGMSQEKARSELAQIAGNVSELSGATIGMLAGRIAARFEAAPMSPGSIRGGAVNVLKETVEEGLQEFGNQFSSNAGVVAAGFDRSLIEGGGEAAGAGIVGGAGTAAALQGPGAALSLTVDGVRLTGDGAKFVYDKRMESIERKRDAKDPVGSQAMANLSEQIEKDAQALTTQATPTPTEANQTTSNQTEAGSTEPVNVSQVIQDAVFLSDEEAAAFPDEFKSEDGRVSRSVIMLEYGKALLDDQAPVEAKRQYAVALLEAFDKIRAADSTEANMAAQALDESDVTRIRFERLKEKINTMESLPSIKKAQKLIQDLDQETVEQNFDFTDIVAGNLDTDGAKQTIDAMKVIGRYNPMAVPVSKYDLVLEQVLERTPEDTNAVKKLTVARDISRVFQEADEASKTYKSKVSVRYDIMAFGNEQNDLPSIYGHFRNVVDAANTGRIEDGQDALKELREFARSQINKFDAFNRAAREGKSSAKDGITYQAYGPFRKFFESKPAWVNLNVPTSVALVRDIEIDTRAVVDTFNSLLKTYPELAQDGQQELVMPELDQSIQNAISAPIETDPEPVQKPERRIRKDAKPDASLTDPVTEEGQAVKDAREGKSKQTKAKDTKSNEVTEDQTKPEPVIQEEQTAEPVEKQEAMVQWNGIGLYLSIFDDLKEGIMKVEEVAEGAGMYAFAYITEGGKRIAGTFEYNDYERFIDQFVVTSEDGPNKLGASQLRRIGEMLIKKFPDAEGLSGFRQSGARAQDQESGVDLIFDLKDGRLVLRKDKAKSTETTPTQTEEAVDQITEEEPAVQEEPGSDDVTETEAETKPKALKDVLPDLLQADLDQNQFLKGYSLTGNSKLLEQDSPMETLMREATGLNANQSNQLKMIRDELVPALQSGLDAMAVESIKEPKKGWLQKLMDNNPDILSYKNALALNFRRTNEDGKGEFHPKVVEALAMAVADWMIRQQTTPKRRYSDEDINKKFGRPDGTPVTTEDRQAVVYGDSLQAVLDDMSQSMMTLMGVKADKNQPVKISQGLFRSLAASALSVLEDADLVEKLEHDTGTQKNFLAFRMSQDINELEQMVDALASKRDLFQKVFLKEFEPTFLFEAPTRTVDTVTRQQFNEITDDERKVLKKLQSTPNRFVMPMVEFWDALGDDVFKKLMGFREFNPETTNDAEVTRFESKNTQIERAMQGLRLHMEAAQEHAPETALGRIETFFKWNVSSVGRLQQEGYVTPQGDKVAREIISATNAVLDLENPDHVAAVWLGAAQAFDISIEKKSHEATISEIQELFSGDLKPAVDLIRDWFQTGEFSDPDAFYDAVINSGAEMTAKSMHALLTVARMQHALDPKTKEPEDINNFQTSLALEADGKTDGPINAIINAGFGQFTPHQIEVMAKGGLMLGTSEMSLNEYISGKSDGNQIAHDGDKEDLYEITAQSLERQLDFTNPDRDTAALLTILDTYLDGFSFKDNKLEVLRKLVKNPLTVFLYGSGRKGIAGKMASAVKTEFQSMLTRMIEEGDQFSEFAENPDLLKNLETVFGSSIHQVLKDPKKGELSRQMLEKLTGAIDDLVGEALETAIDEATGGLREAMADIRLATQIQGIAFQDAFDRELQKILPQRDNKKSLLTENDYAKAFQEASKVAPIYTNGAQEFHIVASEKYSGETSISENLKGQYASGETIPRPGDAGVKGQPYLVIGTGDGKMIMNILNNDSEFLSRSLMVFDGVELALDSFVPGSLEINKEVWTGWQEESVTGIAHEGYQAFLRQFKLSDMSENGLAALEKLAKRNKTTVDALIKGAGLQLQQKAAQNRARKRAMGRVQSSIDHMAGAQAPFTNQGVVPETDKIFDPEAVTELLNQFYEEELEAERQKLRDAKDAPAIQKPTPEMQEFLEESGVKSTDPALADVVALQGDVVVAGLSKQKWFSKEQWEVYRDLFGNADALKDVTFYIGSPDELAKLRKEQGLPGTKDIEAGVAYPERGIVLLANATPETILHEALHIQTTRALVDFYTTPNDVSEETRAAVERLEGLMKSFEEMQFTKDTGQDEAARILQSELKAYENSPVEKMGEFLSWFLSNQNLIEIGKETKVHSPLQKIGLKVLRALQNLLGIKRRPGRNMFTNVRFNAQVMVRSAQRGAQSRLGEAKRAARTDGYFEQVYGQDPRMSDLEKKFMVRVQAALLNVGGNTQTLSKRGKANVLQLSNSLKKMSRRSAERMEAAGFAMNQREKASYMAVHQSMMTGFKMNSAAQRKAYELYSEVLKYAKPGSITPLVGQGGIFRNFENRSDLLASFVALGMVSQDFQNILSGIKAPKTVAEGDGTFDGRLKQTANTLINFVTQSAIGSTPGGQDVQSQLMALEDALATVDMERRSTAERMAMKPQDVMNDKLSALRETAVKKTVKFFETKANQTNSKIGKLTYGAAEMVAAFGSQEEAEKKAEGVLAVVNDMEGMHEIRAVMNDLMGVTKTNEPLLDLVNKVKSMVDAMRQDYREKVPELLEKRFSRKLKKDEWKDLYVGLAQTDLVALGQRTALKVLSDFSRLPKHIADAEAALDKEAGKNAFRMKKKAKALAHWMIHKEVTSNNLLRNAEAIARLLGETGGVKDPDPDLVDAIDRLTSLYALDMVDAQTKDSLQNLARTEPEGMKFLVGYQWSTRAMEMNRLGSGPEGEVSKLNGWKGYVPDSTANGHTVIVADDSRNKELIELGYERITDYDGDRKEGYRGSRGYYLSTVGGKAAYRQGVAQTVHTTFNGVDPFSGSSTTGETAGAIRGNKAARIKSGLGKINDALPGSTLLIPVYDENGDIAAYERTMDPKQLEALQQEKHLARTLGIWSGRIVEETQSDFANTQLVNTLKKIYDDEFSKNGARGFINVADPKIKDPVIRDAWKTMGWKIKQQAEEAFGEPDTLWVRKDMVNDALGFHQASVRDAWTGTTRLSETSQKAIKEAATVVFGNNAYKRMVQGETAVSQVVSAAKTTIVVRSLVVIWENLISNNLHLMTWGIGPVELVKKQREKFIEINQYVKNQKRTLELTVELASVIGNKSKENRIKAELKALEDANATMSIKPLIDAGEFSTVSESLTEADQAIRDGKLSEYLEIAADKLPGAAQTAFKNFVITKDTALFQGLNRAVQYGDFVAKAVLYEHLTQEKGKSQDYAMGVIKEEFVNYNRLAGRGRDYLENIGLLWFYNYKLRIMKVMARMLRERPFSALVYAGGVGPMTDIDTVVSGSGLGAYLDNRIGYSIGPEMGINGLFMNPWMNLTN